MTKIREWISSKLTRKKQKDNELKQKQALIQMEKEKRLRDKINKKPTNDPIDLFILKASKDKYT